MNPCDQFAGSDKANCLQVVRCIRDTSCHASSVLDCYCGTADTAQCLATSGRVIANGVCKDAIETAFRTRDPFIVQNQFTDPATPGGAALFLTYCDSLVCSAECIPYASTCTDDCKAAAALR